MAKSELLIHLGPHKTGSTYIQHTLRRNRSVFSGNWNIFLPRNNTLKPLVRSARQIHSFRFDADRQATARASCTETARGFFERFSGDDRSILISHEHLSGFMTGRHSDWAVFPEIGTIAQTILDAATAHDVTFAVYRRDFRDWASSAHNQTVKTDGYTGTMQTFTDNILPGETLDRCIDQLVGTVGVSRVHVFDMDAEIANQQHLGTGLFRLMGLTDDDIGALKKPVRRNDSLNKGSLEFIRQVNKGNLDRDTYQSVLRVVRKNQHLFMD